MGVFEGRWIGGGCCRNLGEFDRWFGFGWKDGMERYRRGLSVFGRGVFVEL